MKVFVACYDIEDDAERERVARVLGEYGERVQKSVFELVVRSDVEHEALRAHLSSVLGDGANLRLYRLCEHCRRESRDLSGEPIARVPSAVIV